MEWQEYQKMMDILGIDTSEWQKTYVKCPICGEYIYKNTKTTLSTYPVKFKYKCFNCDWYGFAHH